MVRAPRAVDLLAKSALAVCSRDEGEKHASVQSVPPSLAPVPM
jgi:hypothetical protein